MYISKRRQSLTFLFVALAMMIALISLIVSHVLLKELAEDERKKMEIWALATESMMSESLDSELVLNILKSNTTIPIILFDEATKQLESHNIKLPSEGKNIFLQRK